SSTEYCPKLTSGCFWMSFVAIRLCLRAVTNWRRPGDLSHQYSITGRITGLSRNPIRREPGVPKQPKRCWPARGGVGMLQRSDLLSDTNLFVVVSQTCV